MTANGAIELGPSLDRHAIRRLLSYCCFVLGGAMVLASTGAWAAAHRGAVVVGVGGGTQILVLQSLCGALALVAFLAASLERGVDFVFATTLAVAILVLSLHDATSELHRAAGLGRGSVFPVSITYASAQRATVVLAWLVLVVCVVGLVVQLSGAASLRQAGAPT